LIWAVASIAGYLAAAAQAPGKSKPIPGLAAQARYDYQGEVTFIGQDLPPSRSKYSGPNSLPSRGQIDGTQTATWYLGARPIPNVEVYANPELAWGNAPGGGNGLGGNLDGDLIGQQQLSAAPDLARVFVRWRIPMRQQKDQPVGTERVGRAPNVIAGPVPQHRLVVTIGRFAASDIFDFNSYANDARNQFLNQAFANGLAYDFAQDPRGYSYGASVVLVNPSYAVRFGSFAMPTEPGGNVLSYNLADSHGENLELEINPRLLRGSKPPATLRFLAYRNVADMGTYSAALGAEVPGSPPPSLSNVRVAGTARTGFELNFEQPLADGGATGVFSRLGSVDGSIETDAYAEADKALSLGAQLSGAHWKRKDDLVGIAFGVEGISGSHQRYLSEGGQGFSLGDGALSYGAESIFEGYYLYQATKRLELSFDLQEINNPGYNQDRGPATLLSVRLRYTF
jgi:high affinity Mn2+ porin